MRVLTGRFAEPRGYLLYCLALLRPGVGVPVFEQPAGFTGDLSALDPQNLTLVIEEGRRHLDRQVAALDRARGRAGTGLTVGLAALTALAGLARAVWQGPIAALVLWAISAALIVLSIAGSAAVLTTQARLGAIHAAWLADSNPTAVLLAGTYADQVGIGDATVAARVTILRDATLLLVLGAFSLTAAWVIQA